VSWWQFCFLRSEVNLFASSRDAPLREHIEFLEQQPGTAGVGYHSLLFSKTEVLPMFTENNALGRSVLLLAFSPQHLVILSSW
jgi:hypothetical protein